MIKKKKLRKNVFVISLLFIVPLIFLTNVKAHTIQLKNKVDPIIPYLTIKISNKNNKSENKENALNNTSKYENKISIIELQKKLINKKLSILGDSISTYEGYSNDYINSNSTTGNNIVFYYDSLFLNNVNATWWMQAINRTKLKLLVNNSSAGDAVTWKGPTRAKQLHNNIKGHEEKPDIIAVYIGINDIKDGISLNDFKIKYQEMVNNIRLSYEDAEIFLFTHIPYTCYNVARSIISPEELELFNNVIRDIANNVKKCNIVDLYSDSEIKIDNYKTYMGDQGLHPNALGMDKITEAFVNALIKKYVY